MAGQNILMTLIYYGQFFTAQPSNVSESPVRFKNIKNKSFVQYLSYNRITFVHTRNGRKFHILKIRYIGVTKKSDSWF